MWSSDFRQVKLIFKRRTSCRFSFCRSSCCSRGSCSLLRIDLHTKAPGYLLPFCLNRYVSPQSITALMDFQQLFNLRLLEQCDTEAAAVLDFSYAGDSSLNNLFILKRLCCISGNGGSALPSFHHILNIQLFVWDKAAMPVNWVQVCIWTFACVKPQDIFNMCFLLFFCLNPTRT